MDVHTSKGIKSAGAFYPRQGRCLSPPSAAACWSKIFAETYVRKDHTKSFYLTNQKTIVNTRNIGGITKSIILSIFLLDHLMCAFVWLFFLAAATVTCLFLSEANLILSSIPAYSSPEPRINILQHKSAGLVTRSSYLSTFSKEDND